MKRLKEAPTAGLSFGFVDLAAELGTTPKTLWRTLKDCERDGWLTIERKRKNGKVVGLLVASRPL